MSASWNPGELPTILVALAALAAGIGLHRRIPALQRLHIPAPVVGGLAVAVITLALHTTRDVEIRFATGLRDILLLVFFATIGLSARLRALREGGRPLALLCLAVLVLLVIQNVAGLLVAGVFGQHPFYGLLMGSASFVGGPGTAMAWATEGQRLFGLDAAPEVGIAAATLAVTTGALVAGPVAGRLVDRHDLRRRPAAHGGRAGPGREAEPTVAAERLTMALLPIALAVWLGEIANGWARAQDFMMPGFLTAMLAGVALGNALELAGRRLDTEAVEHAGNIALQVFLALSLMSLRLWTLGSALWPLVVNTVIQIALSVFVAVRVLFRLLGRDYDAAVTVGSFLGFGLSSMPVAMATMEQLASRWGPSPRALLLITLCGSIFVDLVNTLVIKGFLALPLFSPAG